MALTGGGLPRPRRPPCGGGGAADQLHHLVDPHRSRPADWLTAVTVAAKTCVDANVASTASFMLEDTQAWLAARRLPARLVEPRRQEHCRRRLARGIAVNTHALWYATRGFGVVSLLLLTVIVVLGVAGATRWPSVRWPRFVVGGTPPQPHAARARLHRAARDHHRARRLCADLPLQHDLPLHFFLPPDLARPRSRRVRPLARAHDHEPPCGMRIGYSALARAPLRGGLALWPIALVHGLGTGSDHVRVWMQVVAATCIACGGRLRCPLARRGWSSDGRGDRHSGHGHRIGRADDHRWLVPGRDRRSPGGRHAQEHAVVARARTTSGTPTTRRWASVVSLPTSAFTTRVQRSRATVVAGCQRSRDVDVSHTDERHRSGRPLDAVLQGAPIDGGWVSMTASGASYGPAAIPDAYVGKIVGPHGTQIRLS